MYQENNGEVMITLNHKEYSNLLLCLGYASGAALKRGDSELASTFLQLANQVNLGNPQWIPYAGDRQ